MLVCFKLHLERGSSIMGSPFKVLFARGSVSNMRSHFIEHAIAFQSATRAW